MYILCTTYFLQDGWFIDDILMSTLAIISATYIHFTIVSCYQSLMDRYYSIIVISAYTWVYTEENVLFIPNISFLDVLTNYYELINYINDVTVLQILSIFPLTDYTDVTWLIGSEWIPQSLLHTVICRNHYVSNPKVC